MVAGFKGLQKERCDYPDRQPVTGRVLGAGRIRESSDNPSHDSVRAQTHEMDY